MAFGHHLCRRSTPVVFRPSVIPGICLSSCPLISQVLPSETFRIFLQEAYCKRWHKWDVFGPTEEYKAFPKIHQARKLPLSQSAFCTTTSVGSVTSPLTKF